MISIQFLEQIAYFSGTLAVIAIIIGFRFVMNLNSFKNKILKKNPEYVEPDLQDRMAKSKIPEKIDYIIIGSGTSGLMCAALLGKLGKKVLVLEQHDRLGGCFHAFTEQGFEFDTGFHYVGNVPDFKGFISLIGSKKIEWSSFKHYDTIRIGKEEYKFEAPRQTFYDNLKKEFPEDTKVIDKYIFYSKISLKLIKGIVVCAALPKIIGRIYNLYLKYKYKQIYNKNVRQVFEEIGISKNRKLSVILSGIQGDLGTTQEEMPFIMNVGLFSHYYVNGSMYPKEGTTEIIKSIVSTINQLGGKCLTKARVEQILVSGGKVLGVELRGGGQIKCSNVISTMGIPNTINSLPEKHRFENPYEYDEAFNTFSVFLGINTEGLPEGSVPTNNTWYFPLKDGEKIKSYDEFVKANLDKNNQENRVMFMSFPTAKQLKKTNKHSVCIISETRWSEVEKFRINEVRREKGYAEYKEKILEEFIDEFLKVHPQFEGRIEYKNLGTPLTNETYYNRKTPYGLKFNTEKMFDTERLFNPYTKVKGLYLAGEDLCYPGFYGSLLSGIITTVKATGYL